MRENIDLNSHNQGNSDELDQQYAKLKEKHKKLLEECRAVQDEINKKNYKKHAMNKYISEFSKQEQPIEEFDEGLWQVLLEKVVINNNGTAEFVFKDGSAVLCPITVR